MVVMPLRHLLRSIRVERLFILALSRDTKESYTNRIFILNSLKVFETSNDLSISSNMKLYNILLGIQTHAVTYPCCWCKGKKQHYDRSAPLKTLSSDLIFGRRFFSRELQMIQSSFSLEFS